MMPATRTSPTADHARVGRGRTARSDLRFAVTLAIPAVAVVVLLLGYPMGYALYMSMFEWNDKLGQLPQFIGFGNYAAAVGDPQVQRSLIRTLWFTTVTVIGGVALSIGIAVLLNREFRGRTIARVLLLVPWAVPPVVNGIMWKLIVDGSSGLLNVVLIGLGIADAPIQFLADPAMAMNVLIFAEMWKLLPFLCLLQLAALQGIPANLHKAALIDGAGPWKRFTRITLPNLRPTIMFALIVQSMWSLKVFDTIFVLTGGSGGPAEGTTTISFLTYIVSFSNLDRGYGASLAILAMILVLIVAGLWTLLLGRRGRSEI